jgi:hypothetical protein
MIVNGRCSPARSCYTSYIHIMNTLSIRQFTSDLYCWRSNKLNVDRYIAVEYELKVTDEQIEGYEIERNKCEGSTIAKFVIIHYDDGSQAQSDQTALYSSIL